MSNINNTEQYEYNQRQYNRMAQMLAQFEAQSTTLGDLVASLDFLNDHLQLTDVEWHQEFERNVSELDLINGLIHDETTTLTNEDKMTINDCVSNLKTLILSRLASEGK